MIASLLSIKKMSLIEEITVENPDEYKGIVGGLIDEIRIVEVINQKLGVDIVILNKNETCFWMK